MSVFRHMMLAELPVVLGVEPDALPPVFASEQPSSLKIGAFDELLDRLPDADRNELRRWLRWWCRSHPLCPRGCPGRPQVRPRRP